MAPHIFYCTDAFIKCGCTYTVRRYFTVVSGSGGASINYFMYRKLCHVVFPKWFPK